MRLGLRIDVDTFRGTRLGVPNLCNMLAGFGIKATFFFSVGPDNMGRNLWRLTNPVFFKKMLRTKGASLYGWDIFLRGTLGPGPVIGKKFGGIIRTAADEGHEIGLHAWDHYAWQNRIDRMDGEMIYGALEQGMNLITDIIGYTPPCSAAPAWKCNDIVLKEKLHFPFQYNSDCRGRSIFYPVVAGKQLTQPQIPVTLPTYDEVIGRSGITNATYNDYLLSLLSPQGLNVLTIHAEVEGIACGDLFKGFLIQSQAKGVSIMPLGSLFNHYSHQNRAVLAAGEIPGRQGWVAVQKPF